MIKFEQLVQVIHDAALAANKAVENENLKVIDKYFESADETKSSAQFIEAALQLTDHMMTQDDPDFSELGDLMEGFVNSKKTQQSKLGGSDYHSLGNLKPKTVSLQCPEATRDGTRMKNIKVPLIALVPITLSEISEIKFKTRLEIISDDKGLNVDFSNKSKKTNDKESLDDSNAQTTLEITIRPKETSAGLKCLVQGYEKAIKAQMP